MECLWVPSLEKVVLFCYLENTSTAKNARMSSSTVLYTCPHWSWTSSQLSRQLKSDFQQKLFCARLQGNTASRQGVQSGSAEDVERTYWVVCFPILPAPDNGKGKASAPPSFFCEFIQLMHHKLECMVHCMYSVSAMCFVNIEFARAL
jgi:hypothetical protein